MTQPNSDKTPKLPPHEATSPEESELNEISLDGLLPEILSGPRSTCEATERILQRLSGNAIEASKEGGPATGDKFRVTNPSSRFSAADLERAIQSAQRDRRTKVDANRSRTASERRRTILTVVSATGLAASLMTAAFLTWKSSPNAFNQNVGSTDDTKSIQRNSPAMDSATAENRTPNGSVASIASNTAASKQETLPESSRSAGTESSSRALANSEIASSISTDPSRSAVNAPTETPTTSLGSGFDAGLVGSGLINAAAISVINHQFEDMWKGLAANSSNIRLSTPNAISEQPVASRSDLLVDRIASLLVGRSATSSELEAIRQENLLKTRNSNEDHSQWVDAIAHRWLSSDEFSQSWGNALSSFYRGGYPVEPADLEQAREFNSWLAQQVKLNASVRDIQKQVLIGLSDKAHPARFLVGHWSKLAQFTSASPTSKSSSTSTSSAEQQPTSLHGKVAPQSWIGFNEKQSTALHGVTRLFLEVTDNPTLACSQCHQQSQPLNAVNPASNIGGEVTVVANRTAKPVSYGSISALVLNVLEPNQQELFKKDDEDRAVKLSPVFPNGKRASSTDSPDALVTAWIEEGSHSQRGLVNSLWNTFFGVPLVAREERFGAASTSSREELLNYVSQQASDQNASVRQLVYWMLHSAPTLQPEVPLDIENIIALSQEDLQSLRNRIELQHVMVHRPTQEGSIEEFINRLLPAQQDIQDRALLAQPSSSKSSTSTNPNTPNRTADAGLAKVHSASSAGQQIGKAQLIYSAPPMQFTELAARFSESNLSQAELIEHTYGFLRGRMPSSAEQAIWSTSRLKEFSKQEAALRILSGVSAFEYPSE